MAPGPLAVLDLDGDRAAVEGDRAVHLPDRGGGYGLRIPAGERPFRRRAEFFRHDGRGQLQAHRRDAVLQAGQGAADGGREAVIDVAGHLADLHHDALLIAPRVSATSSAVCRARSSRSSWRCSPAAANSRGALISAT